MKPAKQNPFYLLFIGILFFFIGCEKGTDSPNTEGGESKNENANTETGYAQRMEVPHLDAGNYFVTHTTSYQSQETPTFCLEYNSEQKHSRWVAFTFSDQTAQTNWNRNGWNSTEWKGDPFQPDPSLSADIRTELEDYVSDGRDRGHLCASADRLYSKDANEQTFYLSNMSPQLNAFNTGIWLDLEGQVQTWGRNSSFRDTLYVVKGGTIGPNECAYTRHRVAIPNHYFMALLCKKSGSYKAIAFYMPHSAVASGSLTSFALSVDELEKLTGIDFFCNLPDKVEKAVEATFYPTIWGLP